MSSHSAVWLYGSMARRDSDESSDIDLLQIDRTHGSVEIQRLPSLASLSTYTWDEIEVMATYGSLFLVHLREEGIPLLEGQAVRGRLQRLLDGMRPYSRVTKDIQSFYITLGDVAESVVTGGSLLYEMSVLGTLIRNMSILGCYLAGSPDFGRTSAIERFAGFVGLSPQDTETLVNSYTYQMHAAKGAPAPACPDESAALEVVDLVSRVVNHIGVMRHDYQSRLS